MHAWRSITVALAIGLAAVAQQLCCCVLSPTVDSLLAHEVTERSPACCHHDHVPGDTPADDHDHGSLPCRHDCECRTARTFAPVNAESGIPRPVLLEFGVLPLDLPLFISGFDIEAAAALRPPGAWGREWGGVVGRHAGQPGIPLALRVLFTV